MKKFISFLVLTVVLAVSSLSVIPVSADDSSGSSPFGSGTLDNIEQTVRQLYNIPAGNKIFIGRLADNHHWRNELYFVEVVGFQQAEYVQGTTDIWTGYAGNKIAGCMFFKDSNGDPMSTTVITHTINNYTDSGDGYTDHTSTYNSVGSYFFLSEQGFAQYNGLEPQEFARVTYNMNEPPDVFTYTINPTNFTLKNGSQGNITVDIQFTQAFKQWLSTAHSRGINIDGRYNVCVWVSAECPVDTNSVLSSMTTSRYTKLNYGQYIYEGGGLSEQLQQEQTGDITSTAGSLYPLRIKAQGVCITSMIDPAVEHNTITVATENIKGFDEHTPVYVCVLGAYPGLIQDSSISSSDYVTAPDMFNMAYYQTITSNGGVNGCYQQYDFNGNTVSMHSYWFPFASAASAVGDGYQGNCVYTPQTVNGKGYNTLAPVTELTNKSALLTPDNLHDVRMSENEWVKPEDFNAWQAAYDARHKYGNDFAYDTATLKDVMDKEGSFFSFLRAGFSVFPDYVMTIFVSFLFALLAVVLIKHII